MEIMINKLKWLITDNTYPYRNLATEEYLTMHTQPDECILFLWQNRRTVVIGKNQNCWKECNVENLEKDEGFLVRRLSGGGAVFHDLGNLNFTFCVQSENYDVSRQLQVIIRACQLLGIQAEKTGRNDITVDGRKFSGNAFLKVGCHQYHHGTLMLSVDPTLMTKYLHVDPKKLQAKGVDSVHSRVANLTEFRADITPALMAENLIEAFSEVYGLPAEEIRESDLPQEEIRKLTDKFSSWDWKYGRRIPFDHEFSDRFTWGDLQLQLHVNSGIIEDLNLYSDAMDQDFITALGNSLRGARYNTLSMTEAIDQIPEEGTKEEAAGHQQMKDDLKSLICRNLA